ncbi:MAG: hypothetical protein ACI4AH_00200 [Muribaculaceae bacterium]
MTTFDHISKMLKTAADTAMSIAKIAILSGKRVTMPRADAGARMVILGNGPSLNETIANSSDFLMQHHRLAVNFAANAPAFTSLQPTHYVLADPHFFHAINEPNVAKLWLALSQVDWAMNLFVPTNVSLPPDVAGIIAGNDCLRLYRYNLTPVEGAEWLENWAFKHLLGMPRPRNVLIPSIMIAIACGYRTIYIAGADHSWTRTLSVDDDNNVVSIQPHFYKDDETEVKRVNTEYMQYPLHQILHSFYVAFRSYHTIARYASHLSIDIFNITPGSFIDAFPRKKL